MLSSLHIENIAVIKKLDLDFYSGFSALTGETGAGKSIIIDSINLLLGAKTQRELIRTGEDKATVSAVFTDVDPKAAELISELGFEIEDNSLMIQRTIDVNGKSVCKIDTRTAPLSVLKKISPVLVNIHGQHDTGALLDPMNHIDYLDRFSGTELEDLLAEYSVHYKEMNSAKRSAEKLKVDEREKQRKTELLTYQIEDIESAALEAGEEEKLDLEKKALKSSRQITKSLTTVYRALYKNDKGYSAANLAKIAKDSIDSVSDVLPALMPYSDRLYDIEYELESIASEVLALMPHGAENPDQRLSEIEDRLDIIHKLKRKYGSGIEEILAYLESSKKELESIEKSDELISKYLKIYEKERQICYDLASKMHAIRIAKAKELSCGISDVLKYLDMGKVVFSVNCALRTEIATSEPIYNENGFEDVEFLISTNPGEPMKPLVKIASGGELSRVMLAVKCVLMAAENVATAIFDEVDTGVSGKTSHKIGIKLRELSKYSQTVCITHSAQVAATAHNHYKIVKNEVDGRSETGVDLLDKEGRIDEIARIMGGVNITEKIRETAEEMINSAPNT